MSRERWFSQVNTLATSWREAFHHEPLAGRTEDPCADAFDEAAEIFFNGVKLAGEGDLKAASAQIACAYLLDDRSINFCYKFPAPEAASVAIDLVLLYKLIQHDEQSVSSLVLKIVLGQCVGSNPEEGQTFIAHGMLSIDQLLQLIELNPDIEKREFGVLGGCLTRPVLLRMRATSHMAMGNTQKAIKDLTKALKIDDNYWKARESRASLWASMQLKDGATIHAEYKRILNEVHEDDRGNEVSYAWLALTTLQDPRLGTMAEAKLYYDKCLRSKMRRDELYGRRTKEQEPPVLEHVRQQYAQNQQPETLRFRLELDAVQQGKRSAESVHVPETLVVMTEEPTKKSLKKYTCVKCDKAADGTGTKLMACSRCKVVSYCSRECQKSVRFDHIVFWILV